ncbi:MAG TPA: hypothetical protein QGF58_17730 [Myxococcota bacterium]|nr:hypothetical protein [Myxococcota bacterium]
MTLMVLGLGCAGGTESTPEVTAADPTAVAALPECADYAYDAETFAYCAFSQAESAGDMGAAERTCELAGRWRDACVVAAAEDHCDAGIEHLLALCSGPACRFGMLDLCPSDDLFQQIELCSSAGFYASDCSGHAAERWLAEGPPPEDIGRLLALDSSAGDTLGFWAGVALHRLGEGSCEDPPGDLQPSPRNLKSCQGSMKRCAREPESCAEL